MTLLLNDVHAAMNATRVQSLYQPKNLSELQELIRQAVVTDSAISQAGGRHAMGGQQFAANALHIDTTALNRVLTSDSERGLLQIEAGATWPEIIAATHLMPANAHGQCWGIRQKQTGVDNVTLGGSISANAHGRGLLMQPLIADIEALILVNANAEVITCSRSENAELFALVCGGYGLFGVIYAATLRLAPRLRVCRCVDVIDIDDAVNTIYRRVQEGCLYGDFQFAIDPSDARFLRRGVLACYRPLRATETTALPHNEPADLDPETWLRLLRLAHTDKRSAFELYSQHYLKTDGQIYWSDTHQLSTYLPGYQEYLQNQAPLPVGRESRLGVTDRPKHSRLGLTGKYKESLVIGELYVPASELLNFLERARALFVGIGSEVIYGTIRSIRQDRESFLPWAQRDFVCVVFNLRTEHSDIGINKTKCAFQGLIDIALDLDGNFYLTYHRYASAAQVLRAYPRIGQFFALKCRYDPKELFQSEWYRHYRAALTQKGVS